MRLGTRAGREARAVTLVTGATSRTTVVDVDGQDADRLPELLSR
jgi:uncharacterized protein YggU (UPF0235/DUF167 family)